MKVTVTKSDFNKATQNCLGKKKLKLLVTDCMVATAIRRMYNPEEANVGFCYANILPTKGAKRLYFDIPENVTQAIYDWAAGEHGKVEPLLPLTFELEVVPQ